MMPSRKYLFFSLCINSLFLSCFALVIEKHSAVKNVAPNMLKAFVYQQKEASTQSTLIKKIGFKKAKSFARKKFSPNLTAGNKRTTDAVPAILKLLHEAIAAHQNYPADAAELNQKGRVKIAFDLQPNGTLTHITLLQSSGYASIDSAALLAVQASSPLTAIKNPVVNPQTFSIEVVFA